MKEKRIKIRKMCVYECAIAVILIVMLIQCVDLDDVIANGFHCIFRSLIRLYLSSRSFVPIQNNDAHCCWFAKYKTHSRSLSFSLSLYTVEHFMRFNCNQPVE